MKKKLTLRRLCFVALLIAGFLLAVAVCINYGLAKGWAPGIAILIVDGGAIGLVVANDRQRALRFQRLVDPLKRSATSVKQTSESLELTNNQLSNLKGVLHNVSNEISHLSAVSATVTKVPPQVTSKPKEVPVVAGPVLPTRLIGGDADVKHPNNLQLEQVTNRSHAPIRQSSVGPWLQGRQGYKAIQVSDLPRDIAWRTPLRPFSSDVPVAIIADEFTFHSFAPEFRVIRLHPANWRKKMDEGKPRLFFCESAWQGGPTKTSPWKGKIYASSRFVKENRSELIEIIQYCRDKGIPTVFWNKEDPTHFGDRINDFIRTAYLFDYILTTAEECVPDYLKAVQAKDVHCLPFAVQPKIFNPLNIENAEDNANFAGTWYSIYPQRTAATEKIMDLVLASGRDLVIYDRKFDDPSEAFRFPKRFTQFVRPSISYEETAEAFKQSRFGITLNTVTTSKTMFARRAFELAASGSVILSNDALGVREVFGDAVIYADTDPGKLLNLDENEYRRMQRAGLDIAMRNTYTHRAESILELVGINFQSRFSKPGILTYVRSESDIDLLLKEWKRNTWVSQVVAVVRDSEPGFQMRLMRRKIPNLAVVSEQELRRGDYRSRALLKVRGVVVTYQDGTWPGLPVADMLSLHEGYCRGPVAEALNGETPLRIVERENLLGCYIPARYFGSTFASSDSHSIFTI